MSIPQLGGAATFGSAEHDEIYAFAGRSTNLMGDGASTASAESAYALEHIGFVFEPAVLVPELLGTTNQERVADPLLGDVPRII